MNLFSRSYVIASRLIPFKFFKLHSTSDWKSAVLLHFMENAIKCTHFCENVHILCKFVAFYCTFKTMHENVWKSRFLIYAHEQVRYLFQKTNEMDKTRCDCENVMISSHFTQNPNIPGELWYKSFYTIKIMHI